ESLDRRRPVGEAVGRAEAFAGELAVAGAALEDVVAIGGVDQLVIGVVEILLVHIEPDQWPLDPWWLRRPLRQGWPSSAEGGGGRGGGGGVGGTSGRRVSPLRRDGMEESARHAAVLSRICASTARPSTP